MGMHYQPQVVMYKINTDLAPSQSFVCYTHHITFGINSFDIIWFLLALYQDFGNYGNSLSLQIKNNRNLVKPATPPPPPQKKKNTK